MRNENYYFNNLYDKDVITKMIKSFKNRLFLDACHEQSNFFHNLRLDGKLSDFNINIPINIEYNLPENTYTLIIDKSIVSWDRKRTYLEKYFAKKEFISLLDIMKNNKMFERRILFFIDKYFFPNIKILGVGDTTLLAIVPTAAEGISLSKLEDLINNDAEWTLIFEPQSDFGFCRKTKNQLFVDNLIPISHFEMKQFANEELVNDWSIYISGTYSDSNLLLHSLTKLVNRNDLMYFEVSDEFKNLVYSSAAVCNCYVINNKNKKYQFDITDPWFVTSIGDTFSLDNFRVWEYDSENKCLGKLLSKDTLTNNYPNVFTVNSSDRILIEAFYNDSTYKKFDNNVKDYQEYYGMDNYLQKTLEKSLPSVISSYNPLDFIYDIMDFNINCDDNNIETYRINKIIELLKDNPNRCGELYQKFDDIYSPYYSYVYEVRNMLHILNIKLENSASLIQDEDKQKAFYVDTTYVSFNNSSGILKDIQLYIDGRRIYPLNVSTQINGFTQYVFFPVSELTPNSIIEVVVTKDRNYIKKYGTLRWNVPNDSIYMPFEFDDISSANIIIYEKDSHKYMPTTDFIYGLIVQVYNIKVVDGKDYSMYNEVHGFNTVNKEVFCTADGDNLTFMYKDPDKCNSYYLTIFEEFYRTSANEKILLYKNSEEVQNLGIFHKHLDANDVVIHPTSKTVMGKWYGITTTNASFVITKILKDGDNSITIPNFCDDPSPKRFKIYVNEKLIDITDDIYTPQELYGDSAVFYFDSLGDEKKYVTIVYSIERLDRLTPIITEDGLIDISNIGLPLFKSDEIYINGYKYPIELLKEVSPMIYKPITKTISSEDKIVMYKYECDADLYQYNDYKMNMISDNIARANSDFRNYLIYK